MGRAGAVLRIARLALRHLPPLRRTMARVLAVGQLEHVTAGATREPCGCTVRRIAHMMWDTTFIGGRAMHLARIRE